MRRSLSPSCHSGTRRRGRMPPFLLLLLLTVVWDSLNTNLPSVSALQLVMMGARRNKVPLNRILEDDSSSSFSNKRSINSGKGQEITGVTLPANGQLKGWEFGEQQRLVCANVGNSRYYALQGNCPRCGFDLWKGELLLENTATATNKDVERPSVACPTCRTTYSLRTGKPGPALAKPGWQVVMGQLAQTATVGKGQQPARVYRITCDDDTRKVYLREVA
jgi:nitrite reductase/ring-hydroxylating ferredoxin subunit